ncbi:unnamed protein product [Miscanthus lutarioriparius]|uniref:Uncharacterized protein n=1 Tax=Miscanthus lutarioriparius TaxID=422564 RepID=A0A811SBL8_9POAL|nr:unnamed protein product [Miscanthus lutarioriparius]
MGNTCGFGHIRGLRGGLCADVDVADLMQAAGSNAGHLMSGGVLANRVERSQYQSNTEDIDESSAEELRDATSYAKDNALLIQVPVLGTTTKTFWRLSDEATRISRKLALILRNYHSKCKCLTAPLQVSNVWVGSAGDVKLRGARFTTKGFSIERVRDDYKNLSRVLKQLISISGGDINKLPPDYSEFLLLLTKDNLTTEDEFLIVNNAALLPLKNRTEVFLMLYDRIVKYLGRKNRAKRNIILSSLPYENDWLDTATSNTKINQWVVKSDVQKKEYKRTALDLLRLNRNVRSHLHEYGHDDDIEEILYCEWPMLLIAMEKQLHMEGELQDTDIKNKFG